MALAEGKDNTVGCGSQTLEFRKRWAREFPEGKNKGAPGTASAFWRISLATPKGITLRFAVPAPADVFWLWALGRGSILDVHGVVGDRLRRNFLEPVRRLGRNGNHVAFGQV